MKTKTLSEVSGTDFINYELKPVEILDELRQIRVNFFMCSRVIVRTEKTRLKPGKNSKGAKKIAENFDYKVVVNSADFCVVVAFKKRDMADVFAYNLFYSDVFKFVFDDESARVVYSV